MNTTVNINLGGLFFHIDEDAYQKLTRYFDAIKRSLSNSSGQDEIINDIEMRVSELLNEKQKSDKHVIGLKDVDEVIAIMGQPEDYKIDDENSASGSINYSAIKSKKLYRDTEKGMIGGVAAGLSHYFGIDIVWIRIVMLLLLLGAGTGVLAYIIFWIVVPEAKTTAEKIEMSGEPVTISNIEKKVRAEFDSVSEKIKNVDYDKYGNQIKSNAGKIGTTFGNFIVSVFSVFAKVLGILLIFSGLATLILLLIAVFTLGSSSFIEVPWQSFIDAGNFTDYPIWSFGLLMFFAVGIPFFFLTLLGFKLVSPKIKSIGNIAKYTLLALWIIAVAILISIGVQQATEVAYDGKTVEKATIIMQPTDTLYLKFKYNDYYSKDINDRENFKFVQDSADIEMIYSNNVGIKILATDAKFPYIQIEKSARGKTFQEAKKRADKIKYNFKIVGNSILLDNYILTEISNKFRGQEVKIFLYLPMGTLLIPDASVQEYDESDDSYFNLHYSSDKYVYKVGDLQVKCLNCPADENEYNDVEEAGLDQNKINIKDKNVLLNINGVDVITEESSIKTINYSKEADATVIKIKSK